LHTLEGWLLGSCEVFVLHILFKFINGPWGGGNQFLKALRNEFIKMGVYEEIPEKADAILFNSYPFGNLDYFQKIYDLKNKYGKLIFHRLDGPIFLARGCDLEIDQISFEFNNLFADGTIFQSNWVKDESEKLGMKNTEHYKVIINAPDISVFNTRNALPSLEGKFKLIASSWSTNARKGFDIYQWLDENLDFNNYEFTFVGNSPVKFKNIKHIKAVPSDKLAQILKNQHLYISASKVEACSNAIIEALHLGLPCIGYNNGGNREIMSNAGELFNTNEELLAQIQKIENNYLSYVKAINMPTVEEIARSYYAFMKKTSDKLNKKSSIKLSSQKLKNFNMLLSEKGTTINYESNVFSRIKNIFK